MKRLTMLWVGGMVALCQLALALPVQWIGNTGVFLNGNSYPFRYGYIEPYQTLTVTTQTWPIGPLQGVRAIVTTDNFATSQEYVFTYDKQVGNNSQWYAILGPFPGGKQVKYYLEALSDGVSKYDNNGAANFDFYSRPRPTVRKGAILQWFQTDYKAMMRRLPEVAKAGYEAIYLPPPTKSGGGTFSTGFNPFDRFDLGDRFQLGTVKTQYGTTQELQDLIRVAKRFGIEVYCDIITNHNDNRGSTPINKYPDLIPEDFHIFSSANTTNTQIDFNTASTFSFGMVNHDLLGLADIAHEDGNNMRSGTFTLPAYATNSVANKPSFVRHPVTPQYYPGTNTPAAEDVNQYMRRWMLWLSQTIGFDGFRIDAVKHTPPGAFGWAPDQAVGGAYSNGNYLPWLHAQNPNLYVFGENADSDENSHREYIKTGMNTLDFPLVFKLRSLLNANGFGNLGTEISNGYGINGASGMPYKNGGYTLDNSVAFLQSHDDGPPEANNLGYAFLLTREARPIVYYDGNNIQPGLWTNFPRPGRFDALGQGSDLLTRIVDFRNRAARGSVINRSTSANLYIYESQVNGSATGLIGLNIRGDLTALTATVDTAFPAGTVLEDQSGQQPNVTVQSNGKATITVPSNSDATVTDNARGYVLYAPKAPKIASPTTPVVSIYDATRENTRDAAPFASATYTMPNGTYGTAATFDAVTVTSNKVTLKIKTDSAGYLTSIKLNQGLAMAGQNPGVGTTEGLRDGFVTATKVATGNFSLVNIDLAGLDDGLHLFRVRVFADTGSAAPVFRDFLQFFYLRRGLGGPVTVDGDLTDMGSPLQSQTRNPSFNGNRVDAMYVTNDDKYIYVGLAGRVETSENLTNGALLFLDTDQSVSTGVRDFQTLTDDSGPSARLISNPRIQGPSTFGADFAVGMFRGSAISSAPEAPFVGQLAMPPAIGAQAALFQIDKNKLGQMIPKKSLIVYQERTNKTDPAKGWEMAFLINDLYPNGVAVNQKMSLIAGLANTGESNTTLVSTDVSRATLGGRPAPSSWISNQFLPTQPNIISDPGTGTQASVLGFATYTLRQAATVDPSRYTLVASPVVLDLRRGRSIQNVTVTNTGSTAIGAPLSLLVKAPSFTIQNRSGISQRDSAFQYITSKTGIPVGQSLSFSIEYKGNGIPVSPVFELKFGDGVL